MTQKTINNSILPIAITFVFFDGELLSEVFHEFCVKGNVSILILFSIFINRIIMLKVVAPRICLFSGCKTFNEIILVLYGKKVAIFSCILTMLIVFSSFIIHLYVLNSFLTICFYSLREYFLYYIVFIVFLYNFYGGIGSILKIEFMHFILIFIMIIICIVYLLISTYSSMDVFSMYNIVERHVSDIKIAKHLPLLVFFTFFMLDPVEIHRLLLCQNKEQAIKAALYSVYIVLFTILLFISAIILLHYVNFPINRQVTFLEGIFSNLNYYLRIIAIYIILVSILCSLIAKLHILGIIITIDLGKNILAPNLTENSYLKVFHYVIIIFTSIAIIKYKIGNISLNIIAIGIHYISASTIIVLFFASLFGLYHKNNNYLFWSFTIVTATLLYLGVYYNNNEVLRAYSVILSIFHFIFLLVTGKVINNKTVIMKE